VGAGIAAVYAAVVLGASVAAVRAHGIRVATVLAGVFPMLHVSYGVGFLRGVVDHVFGLHRRGQDAAAIPLSR
jgi:hypothetical protein